MMQLEPAFLAEVTECAPRDAWRLIVERVLSICGNQLSLGDVQKEAVQRERRVGVIDTLVSSTAWELWEAFPDCVEGTSTSIASWWTARGKDKALLILDGLSLRELPWLTQGAAVHGLSVEGVKATAAEIPAGTQFFARALGFSSRSSIANNQAGIAHRLSMARTECSGLPWKDASDLVDASPSWVFWHEWPDSLLHRDSGMGQGLERFSRACADELESEAFWRFVGRLAQGRRLVITSDHGYAASGLFTDAPDKAGSFLKSQMKSGRYIAGDGELGPYVPPMMVRRQNGHGVHRLALGRWKWKSQGGYPTLSHGGMSLLEVLVPWVELSGG
jgi:hypothetical protein